MIKWIVSGVLFTLAIIFACLKSVWAGFIYLGISCLSILSLYWVVVRIKLYIKDYHINFEKAFLSYKADYINSSNISAEEFENQLIDHLLHFKKLFRREKVVDIFKILFIFSLFVVCVVAMITL